MSPRFAHTPRRRYALPVVGVIVAMLVWLVVPMGGTAQNEQPTVGTYYFKVTIGGSEFGGFFREAIIKGGAHSVRVQRTTDQKGAPLDRLSPGKASVWTITLKRGIDSNDELFKWYARIRDGQVAEARRDGTIEIVDWEGKTVVTYRFERGWPTSYGAPRLDAGGNEILLESLTIVVEGFERV